MTKKQCGRPALTAARVGAMAMIFAGVVSAKAADGSDTINIVLDQATITRLPDRVATLVIGNPLIADASIQPGGMMVLTGKGYGVTNLVALDRDGSVLMDRSIRVSAPRDHVVVVYRGVNRESYSCVTNCERRVTLGDTPEFFDSTLGQTGSFGSTGNSSGQKPSPR